jgi:putative oxidoreductase
MTFSLSLGLLVLRLFSGLIIAAHGLQKLVPWSGGPGFTKMVGRLQQQGFKPAWFWTCLAVVGELGGGLSVVFGFLTPLGAAGVFGAMVIAVLKSHWKNGFWLVNQGYEYALLLLGLSISIGFAGPGSYSLDNLLGITLPTPQVFCVLAIIALLVDIIGIVMSRQPATEATAHSPS